MNMQVGGKTGGKIRYYMLVCGKTGIQSIGGWVGGQEGGVEGM